MGRARPPLKIMKWRPLAVILPPLLTPLSGPKPAGLTPPSDDPWTVTTVPGGLSLALLQGQSQKRMSELRLSIEWSLVGFPP